MSFLSRIVLLVVIFLSVLDAEVKLKSEYCFETQTVTLGDIDKDINSTSTFFEFPKNVTNYKILSSKLIDALKDIDINATSEHSIIELKRGCGREYPKEFISSLLEVEFRKRYSSIEINSIEIQPKGVLDEKLDKRYIKKAVITPASIKRSRGSFFIVYDKERQRRIYFDYEIKASLSLFVTTEDMNRRDVVDIASLEEKRVLFDRLRSIPADLKDLQKSMLKRYLSKQSVVFKRDLVRLTDIKKNSMIKALIKDGAVELFFSVEALEDADIGDTVRVRKKNGKEYRALVVSKNLVIIK